MKATMYTTGSVFLAVSVLIFFSFSTFDENSRHAGYGTALGLLLGGTILLAAAAKSYKGGLYFLVGIVTLCIAIFFASSSYGWYVSGLFDTFTGGIVITLVLTVLACVLLSLAHHKHKRLTKPPDTQAAEPAPPHSAALMDEIPGSSAGSLSPDAPPVLYPPTKSWRVYLLLILSWTLYSAFLCYRAARDIRELGDKSLKPALYAVGAVIPIACYFVFFRIAKRASELARQNGIRPLHDPALLTAFFVLASALISVLPDGLFVLTLSILALPWLLLHRLVNQLRLAHPSDYREPPSRYTWKQRVLVIAGIPMMYLVILGAKPDFMRLTGKRLVARQAIAGHTPVYKLRIPDDRWRKVPPGTLYPDTDLELMAKSVHDWVVVRVQPNQQRLLDNYVDTRKTMVAGTWPDFIVTESRSLDSGAYLVPKSLARYSNRKRFLQGEQYLYVTTIVTPEKAVEVIGQGSKDMEPMIEKLVGSLRLVEEDGK